MPAAATRTTATPARSAPWLFLPVLGAPLAHAPVLRYDLLPALKRPIDGGRTLGGRRILGDNKTWRGAAVMFAGARPPPRRVAAAGAGAPHVRARGRDRVRDRRGGPCVPINLVGYATGVRSTPI
jgi:hypothetical protein